ncbi:acyl-coenzyme A diphosphatase NUDT19-like isoform X4 [Tachypleus tridentatus]|uniref:acyl-coenzyme A diphosphatase NUDT19-like isoform X4 n=1 Tax=Tachypleus tridentatus TaxID=6853 RepID=UPI003FCF8486
MWKQYITNLFGFKFSTRILTLTYNEKLNLKMNCTMTNDARAFHSCAVNEVAAQPWQEASSLIIASKTTPQQLVGNGIGSSITAMKTISEQEERCDYHILMVKRSSLSSFMANAFVFPGGLVEEADFSSAWWNVFEKAGASKDSLLQKFCNVKGPRPFMLRNPLLLSSLSVSRDQCIPADLAFRIAAIRETFEETGVLIGRYNMDDTKPTATSFTKDKVEIAQWKQKLKKNPFSFIDLCLECKICPDLWSLYEWSSWLTPTFFGHKRFDTMFYICFIEKLPEIMLDESEVVTFIVMIFTQKTQIIMAKILKLISSILWKN